MQMFDPMKSLELQFIATIHIQPTMSIIRSMEFLTKEGALRFCREIAPIIAKEENIPPKDFVFEVHAIEPDKVNGKWARGIYHKDDFSEILWAAFKYKDREHAV